MEKLKPWDKNFDIYIVAEKLNEIIDYINEREEEVNTGKEQLTIPVVSKTLPYKILDPEWHGLIVNRPIIPPYI